MAVKSTKINSGGYWPPALKEIGKAVKNMKSQKHTVTQTNQHS
jgi:hypothetical protein